VPILGGLTGAAPYSTVIPHLPPHVDVSAGRGDSSLGRQAFARSRCDGSIIPVVHDPDVAGWVDADVGKALQRSIVQDVVVLGDFAAAMGTNIRKRRFQDFVEGRGRRGWSMAVLSVRGATLAAGLFAPWLGRTFGERGRLSFAGAFLVRKPPLKFGDTLQEFRDVAIAFQATRAWSSTMQTASRSVARAAVRKPP
jgi:hypothetical protein